MKFTVERDVLAEAVGWTARSLPLRPTSPVLNGLLIKAEIMKSVPSRRSRRQ